MKAAANRPQALRWHRRRALPYPRGGTNATDLIGRLDPSRISDFGKFGYTEVLFPGIDARDE